MILVITNKIADNDVSELCAVIHEASNNADAESKMKWSYMSK